MLIFVQVDKRRVNSKQVMYVGMCVTSGGQCVTHGDIRQEQLRRRELDTAGLPVLKDLLN